MDILQQKLIKFWSRDTLICDNVLGSGSPTPPGVEFWRTKIRFYPPGHRKPRQQHKRPICRAITLRGKTRGLKKSKDSRWTVGHFWSSANSPGSTIIIIKILIYSTTTISGEGRSEYTPATSTHYSHAFFSYSVGGSQSSQCVGPIPNPALPPYNIKSPHRMAPRRRGIHRQTQRNEHKLDPCAVFM